MLAIETGDTNKVLRTHCRVVTDFDAELKSFIAEMIETMQMEDPETGIRGVGLAANQVGDTRRIVVVTFHVGEKRELKVVPMINPEITWKSPKNVSMEEGCLSLPGVFEKVTRTSRIQARWQDIEGEWHERKMGKWDARILLHEIDHLDGVLFTDYQKG
ncbi:MAG: peptide deformylase [Epsilonproteobacteria bacterium]|nr:MAG: peptide deformylase [Campylobacterota bacterium]